MKKFFSLIALVGVFAACQPEDLKTYFESTPAQLTINVTKVVNSVDGEDVTTSVNTTKTNFEKVGTPDIEAGTAVVKATYRGAEGSTEVAYPHILADSDPVVLSATVFIPGSAGDYTISVEPVVGEPEVFAEYILQEAKSHGTSHAGYDYWLENASDYTLLDTCSYDDVEGEEMVDEAAKVIDDAFEAVVNANYEAIKAGAAGMVKTPVTDKDFEVPAWSFYNAINTVYVAEVTYNVKATPDAGAPEVGENGVVGTFKTKQYSNIFGVKLEEYPNHSGHAGHAGHGAGSNAGGGLVPADE